MSRHWEQRLNDQYKIFEYLDYLESLNNVCVKQIHHNGTESNKRVRRREIEREYTNTLDKPS